MVGLFIALLVMTIDMAVKSKIVEMPAEAFPMEKLEGRVNVTRVYNEGMACNFKADEPEKVRKISTIVLAVFTLLSLPLFFSKKARKIKKLGASLIIGGAASNLYDRYQRGKVVDYIEFNYKKPERLSGITYNLSDFFILAGVIMYGMGRKKKRK